MKRILAMVLASVIVVSSPAAIAYAEDGSKSVTAKDIEALQKEIAALNDTNKELNQKIEMLTEAVKAKDTNITINNNPTITNSPTNTNSPSNTNSFSPTNTNTNTNKNKNHWKTNSKKTTYLRYLIFIFFRLSDSFMSYLF